MSKALAKKEEKTEIQTSQPNPGSGETILKSDVIVPRLLLMQGLSELVNQRKAQQGDIVRSITGEKVGDDKKPVKFIPITFLNQWVLTEKVGKKFEFRGIEPRTSANESSEWEFEKDGSEWKRVKALDLFALLVSDIEAEEREIKAALEKGEVPDLNKALVPVLIRFQSTGFQAGRQVVQHFAKAQKFAKFGVQPYAYTLELSCHSETNDLGSYFVFDVSPEGKKATPSQVEKAKEWHEILRTQKVSVDEEQIVEDTRPAVETTGKSRF